METLELFYPQIEARAGPYALDAGIEFEIFSAKSSYWCFSVIEPPALPVRIKKL